MPAFEYDALDLQGRTRKGVIEADAQRQARMELRRRGLWAVRVERVSPQGRREKRRPRRAMSRDALVLFTRQFATLVKAGIPIVECLAASIEQSTSLRSRAALAELRSRVLEGQSLAAAMAAQPKVFDELYRHMVAAGEQSGDLGEVLERLAYYVEEQQAIRQKLLLALIYPSLVTGVAAAIVFGLLAYVVPQVTRVFAGSGGALPLATRILLAASEGARAILLGSLAGAFAVAAVAKACWSRPRVRAAVHARLLRLPVAGRLIRTVNGARLASTLGILTASGVPLLAALGSSIPLVRNLAMREAMERALREVEDGGALSTALGRSKLFSPLLVHLVAGGESSGKLDEMLAQAAAAQARELQNWIATLTAALEPALILVMGAIVLFIVLAILSPIMQMNQLLR